MKPAVSATVHLFLAACLWTAVGIFLSWRAVTALSRLGASEAAAAVLAAAVLGGIKGMKILRPAAVKGVRRIEERGDGRCLGGFLSWKSWLFVLGMGGFGMWMRSVGLHPALLGGILGAVGVALFLGALVYWTAWLRRIKRT